MSDKDIPFILLRILTIVFAIFSFRFLCVNSLNPSIEFQVEIASKMVFPANCVDNDGNTRTHLENWTTGCDRRVCYEGALETLKWQINYDCPDEIGVLDTTNCSYQNDSTLTFPQCCPYLVCANSTASFTTVAPCADRSPSTTCTFWKEKTNCTTSTDSLIEYLYNLTVLNCIDTCGYCNDTNV